MTMPAADGRARMRIAAFEFDAPTRFRQAYGCIPKQLKARHPGAPTFDRAMILFDDIVEVATASHHHVLPLRVLPSQKPQRLLTRYVAIERYLARPPWQARRQSFPKERLRGRDTAIRTRQEVHCLAVLVHGTIEVMPLATDTDVRFIHSPGGVHAACPAIPSLLELRHVPDHLTQDRRVGHGEPALSHHGHKISIAQPVGDVPANAPFDGLALEPAPAVDRVAGYRFGRWGTPVGARILRRRRQCTRTANRGVSVSA
jgi:hypothetical protein